MEKRDVAWISGGWFSWWNRLTGPHRNPDSSWLSPMILSVSSSDPGQATVPSQKLRLRKSGKGKRWSFSRHRSTTNTFVDKKSVSWDLGWRDLSWGRASSRGKDSLSQLQPHLVEAFICQGLATSWCSWGLILPLWIARSLKRSGHNCLSDILPNHSENNKISPPTGKQPVFQGLRV